MSRPERTVDVMDLLARLRAAAPSPEEQQLLAVALNAMLFITSTGQRYAFADFLQHLESNAPPAVVASFATRQHADDWLNRHPTPPDSALVLIGGQYHAVLYLRETNHRRLTPLPIIESHLGRFQREGLPSAVASFTTHEEAEAWLRDQDDPSPQSVVLVSGEPFLAVVHRNVGHRALHPLSKARDEPEPPTS